MLVGGHSLQETVGENLYIRAYGENDALETYRGPVQSLETRQPLMLDWQAPDTHSAPIAEVGIEVTSTVNTIGTVLLDTLTWNGTPDITLGAPKKPGKVWQRAWVDAASNFNPEWCSAGMQYRVISNDTTRLVTQGEWSWSDYEVSTTILPHLVQNAGVAVCIRGLRRYVVLSLDTDHKIQLIRQHDGTRTVLAEFRATWEPETAVNITLKVTSDGITATVGDVTLTASGDNVPNRGLIGMLVTEGHAEFGPIRVKPAS